MACSLLRFFRKEPRGWLAYGISDGSYAPVEKLMTCVHILNLGGAHESLDMVWTWYWYGVDVDCSISVLHRDDCHDGLVLAARCSATLVRNDGRPSTRNTQTDS